MRLDEIPLKYVEKAIRACLDEGVENFNVRVGKDFKKGRAKFGSPLRYAIERNGQRLSNKAVLAEARNLYLKDHPEVKISDKFSGGRVKSNGAAAILERIGIEFKDVNKSDELVNLHRGAIIQDDDDDLEIILEVHQLSNTAVEDLSKLIERTVNIRRRNLLVRAQVLKRAEGVCELCDQDAPFITVHQTPYLEVHHVMPLSKDGLDKPENMGAICPTCHRNIHSGIDGFTRNTALCKKIFKLTGQRRRRTRTR